MNLTLSEKYIGQLKALGHKEIASYLEYAIDEIRAIEQQVEILTDTTTHMNKIIYSLNRLVKSYKKEISQLMLSNSDLNDTVTDQLEKILRLQKDGSKE